MARDAQRWNARPRAAAVVRFTILVVPALAGALTAWAATRLLPEPGSSWAEAGWWLAVIALAVAAVLVFEVLARRFLPLAWLLRLSLAFPDRVPSRMATARRAALGRRAVRRSVSRARAEGLGGDTAVAAEQALILVSALGVHDRRTRGHSERVRALADVLADEIGVSGDDRDRLRWAALLHDIGKLSVPGEILNKPDKPDDEEWATLRRHPVEGGRMVGPLVAWLGPWADAVGQHHERWDGSGYPGGIAGEDISLGGRILAVVDAYEVMTGVRPYKQPLRPDVARRELVSGAGSHFDPELVRRFLGISLGRLWWAVGGSAVLALLPGFVAKLWTTPLGSQLRQGSSAPAAAAAVLAGLLMVGAVEAPRSGEAGTGRPPGEVAAAPGASPSTSPSPAGVPGAVPPTGAGGGAPGGSLALPPVPLVPSGPGGPGTDPQGSGRATPGLSAGTSPAGTSPDSPGSPGSGGSDGRAGPDAPGPEGTAPAESETPPGGSGPGQPAPPGSPPPPGSPRYSASGTTLLPGIVNLTGVELGVTCSPPLTQGVDAVVFELPEPARTAGAPVRVLASGGVGTHSLEVVFLTGDCAVARRQSGMAEVATTLPPGTRYVAVSDRSGFATRVEMAVF